MNVDLATVVLGWDKTLGSADHILTRASDHAAANDVAMSGASRQSSISAMATSFGVPTGTTIDPAGTVEHLRTKKPSEMRLLDRKLVKTEGKDDPRKVLADWITRPDNPYFARAASNWVWAQFFGRGIAEPADDLSRANPPVPNCGRHLVRQQHDRFGFH